MEFSVFSFIFLDEKFFVYYEDMDYCRRIRLADYRLRLVPQAKIWHAVATSSGGQDSPLERYWMAQSSGRYFRKHGHWWQFLVIIPYRFGSALRTTGRLLSHKHFLSLKAYWYGLFIGWVTGKATTPPPLMLTPEPCLKTCKLSWHCLRAGNGFPDNTSSTRLVPKPVRLRR